MLRGGRRQTGRISQIRLQRGGLHLPSCQTASTKKHSIVLHVLCSTVSQNTSIFLFVFCMQFSGMRGTALYGHHWPPDEMRLNCKKRPAFSRRRGRGGEGPFAAVSTQESDARPRSLPIGGGGGIATRRKGLLLPPRSTQLRRTPERTDAKKDPLSRSTKISRRVTPEDIRSQSASSNQEETEQLCTISKCLLIHADINLTVKRFRKKDMAMAARLLNR